MNDNLEKIMIDAIPDGMLLLDSRGTILRTNVALQNITGYQAHDLVGQNLDVLLPHRLHGKRPLLLARYLAAPAQRHMSRNRSRLLILDRNQAPIPIDVALNVCKLNDETCVIAFIRDLSHLKQLEKQVNYQATHDSLTGLVNRWQFIRLLNNALITPLSKQRALAVIMIDLDHFKSVNDNYGHSAGDKVLIQIANRLRAALRPNDILARLGGDEFMVLLTHLDSPTHASKITERLLGSLKAPFQYGAHELNVSASAGVSLAPHDTNDAESLMRFADISLHQAKTNGRKRRVFYSPEMSHDLHRRLRLQDRLTLALQSNTLQLHYQPQVDLATGAVVSVEALLRWTDAELGMVRPDEFIPLAESTGLIEPLGDWVLETACTQLAQWAAMGLTPRIAVNLTAHQFHHEHLVNRLNSLALRNRINPEQIELELTESSAMANPAKARDIMLRLAEHGFKLAIDDFGTGYSSLSYLQMLPIDRVKIDRSFIARLHHSEEDQNLVKGIISLIHSLRKEVVAEGIETVQQLQFLHQQGCNSYQGWYFAKALPAHDVSSLLQARTAHEIT